MSNLTELVDIIEGMAVTFTTQASVSTTPTAYDYQALKNSVQSSGTPARLITPFSDANRASATIGEWVIGNQSVITWTILDQLLWRPASEGLGLGDVAWDIMEYIQTYHAAVNSLTFETVTSGDRVEVVMVEAYARDDIEFPPFSGHRFVGVDCIWTLRVDDP